MDTLFLGFPVPDTVAAALPPLYAHYGSVMKERTPREKLHLTLLWLGPAEIPQTLLGQPLLDQLTAPLPQSFVPTIRLTHVGRGRQREQLWAFGEAAGPVMAIREQLLKRLTDIGWQLPKQEPRRPFTPHITVAALYEQVSHIGVADYPFIMSFTVPEVVLYKSTTIVLGKSTYSHLGSISLV